MHACVARDSSLSEAWLQLEVHVAFADMDFAQPLTSSPSLSLALLVSVSLSLSLALSLSWKSL